MTDIALRPAAPADSEFCFQLHKAAMGAHVTAIWGWDEAVQRDFHARAFDPGQWQIITTAAPGQILGPRPEPGTADESAWQHASAAVAARHLSRHQQPANSPGDAQQRDPSHRALRQAQHDARRDRALAARQQRHGYRADRPQAPQPQQACPDTTPPLLQPPPPEPRQQDRQIGW